MEKSGQPNLASRLILGRVLPAALATLLVTGIARWYAADRGLISDTAGVIVMTGAGMLLLTVLMLWCARVLRQSEALRRRDELDAQYRMIARSFPNGGFFLFDHDLRYVLADGVGLKDVGLSKAGLEGKTIWEALDEETCAEIEPPYRAALRGEETTFEMPYRDHFYRVYIGPVRDDDGEILGGVVVTQKITEQRKLEDQLRQAQKMEAIGQLAGGIAHDFNNLLLAIRGFAELLLRQGLDQQTNSRVEAIVRAADRGATLTKQLLAFSRKQVVQPKLLDLNDLVREEESMLRRLIGEDVQLNVELTGQSAHVCVDPSQLSQVVVNLVVNARDAMPEGGAVMIETAKVRLDEHYAKQHLDIEAGDYIMVAVSDTGTGIEPETLDRIFDPFFTTKPPGAGTGLGLSTVYGIVKENRGHVLVYSEPGAGTSFKVYFPQAHEGAPVLELRAPSTRGGGTERILLVEDDDPVRTLIASLLVAEGYVVTSTADAAEALARCADGEPFDLLVTDMAMPAMSGRELAVRIQASRPEVKTLFISGYADRAARGRDGYAADMVYLQKPFSGDDLADAVREALDQKLTAA